MSTIWKNVLALLLRITIVLIILLPIAYLLSLPLDILFFVMVSLVSLWEKRKQLPSILKRSRVIIGVVLGTALFLGLLLWLINDDPGLGFRFVLLTTAVVILSFGYYDDIRDVKQPEKQQESLLSI